MFFILAQQQYQPTNPIVQTLFSHVDLALAYLIVAGAALAAAVAVLATVSIAWGFWLAQAGMHIAKNSGFNIGIGLGKGRRGRR